MSVVKELQDLKLQVGQFISRVDEWIAHTKHDTEMYRTRINQKMDKMIDKLSSLPCNERKSFYTNTNRQLKFMWGILAFLLYFIIEAYFKN